MRAAHFALVRTDDGWTLRTVAANGLTTQSSGSQVYTRRRDALRAWAIALEAASGGALVELDERSGR